MSLKYDPFKIAVAIKRSPCTVIKMIQGMTDLKEQHIFRSKTHTEKGLIVREFKV